MTARQQRRAAERLARKNPNPETHQPIAATSPVAAALSSRHKTHRTVPAAPAPSSYAEQVAALKLPLLLPGEDTELYRTHLLYFFEQHTPEPGVECVLVQRLADLQWRLQRTANLEAGIMTLGRRKYADLVTETDPLVRMALLDAHTLISEGLALKRLHTQETRLRRFYANDLAELAALQESRTASQSALNLNRIPSDIPLAPQGYTAMPITGTLENGFEFSNGHEFDFSSESDGADCLELVFGSDPSAEILRTGNTSGNSK